MLHFWLAERTGIMSVKRVGIAYHPLNEAAHSLAKKLARYLDDSGVPAWLCSAWETDKLKAKVPGTDLVLTAGGDGTILRVAQAVMGHGVPITGINLGQLGFLAEIRADEIMDRLPGLLDGKGWIDERTVLEARLTPAAGEKSGETFYALNDVVVARGGIARIIYVEASINSKQLAKYKADGVIVATATGSTGYSLSAGGPVLPPQADDFLLTPILPHPGPAYGLVLEPNTVVGLKVRTYHQATLSIDGHLNRELSTGDSLTVKRSDTRVRFLRSGPRDYFYATLEQKLKVNRQ
jgi:NAD+ kinase